MEFHDFDLFSQGGNAHPRICLKSADVGGFWLNHLSEYEHQVHRRAEESKRKALVQKHTERVVNEACSGEYGHVDDSRIIAVVPYWGGKPEKDPNGKVIGNSHSQVSRSIKLAQLRATMCSVQQSLPGTRCFVAVATQADYDDVKNSLSDKVWVLELLPVEHGAFLSYTALRLLQTRIEQRSWSAEFIYFTEADQVLASSIAFEGLVQALGQHVYLAPNRLNEHYPPRPTSLLHERYGFAMNICDGALIVTRAQLKFIKESEMPVDRVKSIGRGKPFSWPVSISDTRPKVSRAEVLSAREAIALRQNQTEARFRYASKRVIKINPSEASIETFVRCWNMTEIQHARAFFTHITAFKHADFDRLISSPKATQHPLVHAMTALFDAKRSASKTTWTFATSDIGQGFSVCRHCHLFGDTCASLRSAPELIRSVALMPWNDDIESLHFAAASICAAANALDAVLIGVCDQQAAVQATQIISKLGRGHNASIRVVSLSCPTHTSSQVNSAPSVKRRATLALLAWANNGIERIWPTTEYVAFIHSGDILSVSHYLSSMKAAASPTILLIAHTIKHSTTSAQHHICGPPQSRDWLLPLDEADRAAVHLDNTAFFLVPR